MESKIENRSPNRVFLNYDLEQFQQVVSNVSDLNAIIRGDFRDGIYHCVEPNRLDLYIENFPDDEFIPIIFVCFNAAVSKREKKCAPFFSGRGLNKTLKVPFIAISDPVVSSTSLGLAWYAGSSQHKDLQHNLAHFLNKIAEKYNARLLILGASGGGFAAMTLATLLKCQATIIASNPQTSISQYLFARVQDYVKQAFPAHARQLKGLEISQRSTTLYNIFDQCGVIHDVTTIRVPDNIKLLYLQNKSDSHVTKHAIPFIQNRDWFVAGNNSIECENVAMYFGSWGKGHVNPSKEILLLLLEKLIKNASLRSVLVSLEKAPTTNHSFNDHILKDLSKLSETASNAGAFPEGYEVDAATRIHEEGRLTTDATYAARIINVAHVIKSLDSIQSEPVEISSPKLKISDIAILRAYEESGKIFAKFEIKNNKLVDELEFAFYLISGGNKEKISWYSDNNSVEFDMVSIVPQTKYQINGFIRRKSDPQKKWSVYTDVT